MADLVRAHLDQMARTDGEPEWNRDRYTMAVTNEALALFTTLLPCVTAMFTSPSCQNLCR